MIIPPLLVKVIDRLLVSMDSMEATSAFTKAHDCILYIEKPAPGSVRVTIAELDSEPGRELLAKAGSAFNNPSIGRRH